MTSSRTALRSLGVLAAASGLALAGAGAASATTAEHAVDGSTVTVTFALEEGELGDSCGAALIPVSAIGGVAELLAATEPAGLIDALAGIEGVTLLESEGANLVLLAGEGDSAEVSADDVAAGGYGLVSVCLSDLENPEVNVVTVGNPLELINSLSAGGGLDSFSSILGGGTEGEGVLDLGTLSSTLGGGDTEQE